MNKILKNKILIIQIKIQNMSQINNKNLNKLSLIVLMSQNGKEDKDLMEKKKFRIKRIKQQKIKASNHTWESIIL